MKANSIWDAKMYSVLRADTTLKNQDQNLQFLAFLTMQTKAELLQLNRTQISFLRIFNSKKVWNLKN